MSGPTSTAEFDQARTRTSRTRTSRKSAAAALLAAALLAVPALVSTTALAQDRIPWERPAVGDLPPLPPDPSAAPPPYQRDQPGIYPPAASGRAGARASRPNDAYVAPPPRASAWGDGLPTAPPPGNPPNASDAYRSGPPPGPAYGEAPRGGYGTPYEALRDDGDGDGRPPPDGRYANPANTNPRNTNPQNTNPQSYERGYGERPAGGTYSQNEVLDAGHRFFGSISQSLASAVESVFQQSGRPNGYVLGEDAGGAFIAGLRYGEGILYTKDAGRHRVYWQGPSLGYDFGGEGSKTMVLVYNLRDPSDLYGRFGGIQGSAYVIGGVGVQFQKHDDIVLALIRSGVGLRLGANVGYLKYTRTPTWNPF